MIRFLQLLVFVVSVLCAAAFSAGCVICNCPPVDVVAIPSSFTVELENIVDYDKDWIQLSWEETPWGDVLEASLSRSGDTVTATYTTDAGTFEAELFVEAVTSPLD